MILCFLSSFFTTHILCLFPSTKIWRCLTVGPQRSLQTRDIPAFEAGSKSDTWLSSVGVWASWLLFMVRIPGAMKIIYQKSWGAGWRVSNKVLESEMGLLKASKLILVEGWKQGGAVLKKAGGADLHFAASSNFVLLFLQRTHFIYLL